MGEPEGMAEAVPQPFRRPLLALILLSPVIAEMLSGSAPPVEWLLPTTPLLLIWLYGSGVLVMREAAVRWDPWVGGVPRPRGRVRDHRGRPRRQVVLRPGLDGSRDPGLVRPLARHELGVGNLADDVPRDHQHRGGHLPRRHDLAADPRAAPPVGPAVSRC